MKATPLIAGSVLHDTYRLTRELGHGGMGSVWEAEHLRLPKQVAIKVLHGAGYAKPDMLARFRREAEIASHLGHPNIVEVHDFNTLPDGTPYLVMERLRGRDLRAHLAHGPLPLDQARTITRQVASALALAHRKGVVHRDLKPENIFLCDEHDGSLHVKVLDFGISKIQGGSTFATSDDQVLGTPGYMAPEQAMGKNSTIDGRTDLFSLATIFYEMLTGTCAFMGETLAEVVYKIVYHTPEPLSQVAPSVPPGVSNAVQRALSKDPLQRQPSMQAFADALLETGHDLAQSQTVAAPLGQSVDASKPSLLSPSAPPRAVPTTGPGSQARRWFFVGAGAAVALVSLLALLWLSNEKSAVQPPPALANPELPAAHAAPDEPPHADGMPASAERMPATREPTSEAMGPDAQPRPTPAKPREARKGDHAAPKAAELPEAVRARLDQADAALATKDFARALQLAKTSLYEAKSPRAYAIMAQAYCGQRDVGMAAAMLRNVHGAENRRVRSYCQGFGLTLAR